jgi:hypothetical protein
MSWRRTVAPLSAAFLFYLAVTAVMTDPLPRRLHGVLASGAVDPALNAWILNWNARATPLTRGYWDAPIFYPLPGMLTLSESLMSLGVLATPLHWAGAGPELVYNVAFLLSFPLSALSAHLLTLRLTGRQDAALVSGLLFGFCPYRCAQVGHLQVLSAYGIPVVLLGLHAFLETRRFRWLLLSSLAWLLQGLANAYYLLYVPVLVALWAFFFVGFRDRPALARLLLAFSLAAVCALPVLLEYRSAHQRLGLRRSVAEIESYSPDMAGLGAGTHLLAFRPRLVLIGDAERQIFPGRIAGLLWLLAFVLAVRDARRDPGPASHASLGLWLVAAGFGLAALSAVVLGPWRLDIPAIPISVGAIDKPLGMAWLCLIASATTSRAGLSSLRRGALLWFYAGATLLLWVLALGPSPTLLGSPVWYKAPYAWLLLLPGFDSLRVTGRFAMLAAATLAVGGGLVVARLLPRHGAWRTVAVALLSLGILAEGWPLEMHLATAPSRSALLESSAPASLAVLELPLGDRDADAAAMYRQCFHGHPLWNGYSGYDPPHYPALRRALAAGEPEALRVMAEVGPLLVRVDRRRDADGSLGRWVAAYQGASLIAAQDEESVYRVAASTTRSHASGPRLSIAAIQANTNPAAVPHLFDGDLESRWHTGPQRGDEEISLDLGRDQPVGAVVLSLGPYVNEFPVGLLVERSTDGMAWTEAFRGSGDVAALRAALQSARDIPMRVDLGGQPARFVRLRQMGRDPVWSWSIAELWVEGPVAAPLAAPVATPLEAPSS